MGSDPAHKTSTRHMSRGTVVLTVALAVVVLALLAGGIVLATRPTGTGSASATTPPQVVPLDVVGTSPAANATNIAPSTAVTVALSTPLAADSPMPTISPSLAGNWSALSPTELQFVSTGPLVPGSQETITVPGGPNGLVSTQGQHLAATVPCPSRWPRARRCGSSSCWPSSATFRSPSPRPPSPARHSKRPTPSRGPSAGAGPISPSR